MTRLRCVPFTQRYLTALAGFDCRDPQGEKLCEWEEEVNLWITDGTDEGVVHDIPKFAVHVWVYIDSYNRIVGFGSLSRGQWELRGAQAEPIPITILYMLGLDRRYQGRPANVRDKTERFSYQLISDLFAKARRRMDYSPLLGLWVHPGNVKATEWYKRLGFEYVDGAEEFSEVYRVSYRGMSLDLRRIPDWLLIEELPAGDGDAILLPPSAAARTKRRTRS